MKTNAQVKLAPSILSADFGRLGEQVKEACAAGADAIHIDVMDGRFVPNITIGPLVVAAVKPWATCPLDVHLMIKAPERHLAAFAKAGAAIITVHIEASPHIHRTLQLIHELGLKAGVSLNPGTPLEALDEVLAYADLILVMSVNPGWGGQAFIESSLDKVRRLRMNLDKRNLKTEIEVDGGVTARNAAALARAGASMLVAGSAVFNEEMTVKEAMGKLRASLEMDGTKV
jgi:ribulose-phosphate 3-epimerase